MSELGNSPCQPSCQCDVLSVCVMPAFVLVFFDRSLLGSGRMVLVSSLRLMAG